MRAQSLLLSNGGAQPPSIVWVEINVRIRGPSDDDFAKCVRADTAEAFHNGWRRQLWQNRAFCDHFGMVAVLLTTLNRP